MREILFRGKQVDNGEWMEGFLCLKNIIKHTRKCFDWRGDYVCDSVEEHKVDSETVGQFTGLTDKNGKKIFEGDIVRVVYVEKREFQGVKYDNELEFVEKVVYYDKNACFMFEIDNDEITMFRPLYDFGDKVSIKSIEVIGNIHDNPELLKGE